jgi:hypothetical protein
MQAVKTTPHIDYERKSHFGTEYHKTPLPTEKRSVNAVNQQSISHDTVKGLPN